MSMYRMSAQKYIDHIEKCFEKAVKKDSKCSQDILDMEGMSGMFTRSFYNNLLTLDDARYLEVGAWKGSSTCSAMYGNKACVTVVDNWSEFGGPRDECIANIKRFSGDNDVTIMDIDSFSVDLTKMPNTYNIYMYDGCHKRESHEKALTYFQNVLDDVFIYVCDDWNWGFVKDGTYDAINSLGLVVEYEKSVYTHYNGDRKSWWNGMVAFVLRKS